MHFAGQDRRFWRAEITARERGDREGALRLAIVMFARIEIGLFLCRAHFATVGRYHRPLYHRQQHGFIHFRRDLDALYSGGTVGSPPLACRPLSPGVGCFRANGTIRWWGAISYLV